MSRLHRNPELPSEPRQPSIGTAYARAGLLGNPGDGYGGKALATIVYDFSATVTADHGDGFAIRPQAWDGLDFPSITEAATAFAGGGCDDGLRLIRAATKRFVAMVSAEDPSTAPLTQGTRLSYRTTIPRQVGLSGSSALVIATLRALSRHYGVSLDPFGLSEAALAAELEDLGIPAGAMDRVVQSYEGTVLMDLADPRSPERYVRVSTEGLPPLFIAWTPRRTKNSGSLHGPLRQRWERGDPAVLDVVAELRALVDEGMVALEARDHEAFGRLMTRNFELRGRIFPITREDDEMVALARAHGCPAKLAGSGGAIVGLVGAGVDPGALGEVYRTRGLSFLLPQVTPRD